MKKILYLLFASILCTSYNNTAFANHYNSVNTATIESSNEEYIDAVEAQDAKGYKTIHLGIYGRRMANGRYYYYAKTKGGTREFGIQFADNNKYKPFYVIINGERWYFNSRALDYNSTKTNQW